MGWKAKLSIIVVICISNLLIIDRYLTGWIAIPDWPSAKDDEQKAIVEPTSSHQYAEPELDIHGNTFKDNHAIHHRQYFSRLVGDCKTPQNTSGKIIYRWLDENGVVNLSNRGRPANANVIVAGTISPDKVTIDLYGDTPPAGFRKSLRKRIDNAIRVFANVTDEAVVVPV